MDGNMSDFGSEDEDAEFALYAQLYFEPNENVNVTDILKTNSGDVSNNDKCPHEKVADTPKRDLPRQDDDSRSHVKTDQEKIPVSKCHQKSLSDISTTNSHEINHASKLCQVNEVQPKDQNGFETNKDPCLQKKSRKFIATEKSLPSDQFSTIDNASEHLAVNENEDYLDKQSGIPMRRRNPSICSVDSISGKVPLDNLYCNVFDSLDEEEELVGESPHGKEVERVTKSEAVSGKRKKPPSFSDSSDEEDSRCKALRAINKKKGKKEGESLGKVKKKDVESIPKDSKDPKKKIIKKRKNAQEIITIDDSDSSENCILLPTYQGVRKVNHKDEVQFIESPNKSARILQKAKKDQGKIQYPQHAGVVVLSEADDYLNKHTSSSKFSFSFPLSSSSSSSDSDCDISMKKSPNLVMNFSNETRTRTKPRKKVKKHCSKQLVSCDYSKRRLPTRRVPSCQRFTQEMANFYDSDESDYFDIEEIHNQQSGQRSDWNIVSSDLYIKKNNRYYNREPRCLRCRQFGHTVSKCPRVPHCYICAETSHTQRKDCPSNCCFRCGGSLHNFCSATSYKVVCALCGNHGHTEGVCPDLWRRYHSTTSGSVPVLPEPVSNTQRRKKYCCACGKSGHYGFECRFTHYSRYSYIIQSQSVTSYSSPVLEVDGKLVVNLEGAKTTKNVSKMEVEKADVGRILGRRGLVMEEISRTTGANLCVYEQNGKSYIQVTGDSRAQNSSHVALEALLGYSLWNPNSSPLMKTLSKNRSREKIVNIVRRKIDLYSCLSQRLPELPRAVEVLRKGQGMNDLASSTPSFSKRMKEALQLASLIVVGHLKWGEGHNIIKHITQVLRQIQKLSLKEKVPLPILEDIACKLQRIDNPHMGRLNDILKLAEKYLKQNDAKYRKVLNTSKNQTQIDRIEDDEVTFICENSKEIDDSVVDIVDETDEIINECGNSVSDSFGPVENSGMMTLGEKSEQVGDDEMNDEIENAKLPNSSEWNNGTEDIVFGEPANEGGNSLLLVDKCKESNSFSAVRGKKECENMNHKKDRGTERSVLNGFKNVNVTSSDVNIKLQNREMSTVVEPGELIRSEDEEFFKDSEGERLTAGLRTGRLTGESNEIEGVSDSANKRTTEDRAWKCTISNLLRALSKGRTRENVLEILRRTLWYYNHVQTRLPELHDAVSVLKEAQKLYSKKKFVPGRVTKRIKEANRLVSLLILARPKDGEIYCTVTNIFSQVCALESAAYVPEHIIRDIKKVFGQIGNPRSKKVNHLIDLAEQYLTPESNDGGDNVKENISKQFQPKNGMGYGELVCPTIRTQKFLSADHELLGNSSTVGIANDEKDDKRVSCDITVDDVQENTIRKRKLFDKQVTLTSEKRPECPTIERKSVNVFKMGKDGCGVARKERLSKERVGPVSEDSVDSSSLQVMFPLKIERNASVSNTRKKKFKRANEIHDEENSSLIKAEMRYKRSCTKDGKTSCIGPTSNSEGQKMGEKQIEIPVEKLSKCTYGGNFLLESDAVIENENIRARAEMRRQNEIQILSAYLRGVKPQNTNLKRSKRRERGEVIGAVEGNLVKDVCKKQTQKTVKGREPDVNSSGLKYPKAKNKRKVISSRLKAKIPV